MRTKSGDSSPKRGEVRFDLADEPERSPLQRFWKKVRYHYHYLPDTLQHLIVEVGLQVVVLGVAVFGVIGYSRLTHAGPPGGSISVPASPSPPGYYAIAAVSHASSVNPDDLEVAYVAFAHEEVQLIRVSSDQDIPVYDRSRAEVVNPSPRDQVVSRTNELFLRAAVVLKSIRIARHYGSAKSDGAPTLESARPYVLHGDVDIRCGSLMNDDQGYANMLLADGNLQRASINLRDGSARGPPSMLRKVYVVGRVRTVVGPEQFGGSTFDGHILDLAPSAKQEVAFAAALEIWNRELHELRLKWNVPEEELRTVPGGKVTPEGDRYTGTNARGESEPIPRDLEPSSPKAAESGFFGKLAPEEEP